MEEEEEIENEELEVAHCLVENEKERVLSAVLMVVAEVEAHSLSPRPPLPLSLSTLQRGDTSSVQKVPSPFLSLALF